MYFCFAVNILSMERRHGYPEKRATRTNLNMWKSDMLAHAYPLSLLSLKAIFHTTVPQTIYYLL